MKITEIRKISTPDLEKKIISLKQELFNLRFQLAVGQLSNTAQIATIKKEIAQMKTVISERNE